MPKAFFRPGMDYFTYRVYLDQAKDNEIKDKLVQKLQQVMIDEGLNQPAPMGRPEDMANISNAT